MTTLTDIPKYGFGTACDSEEGEEGEEPKSRRKLADLIEHAVELGVRHFDCAPLYKTQDIVGKILNNKMLNIPRRDFFITSKLPMNMMRPENIERCLTKTLKSLQLSYLDLYLIHAPFSTQHIDDDIVYPLDSQNNLIIDYEEGILEAAWTMLAKLKRKQLVRYIGLSNINIEQLNRLHAIHPVDVVQNEYHLFNQNRDLFDHCEELDVHFEAYAAFGCPPKAVKLGLPSFQTDPVVEEVSLENNLTKSQVVMQWIHHQPLTYVIKTDSTNQLEENLRATQKNPLIVDDLIKLDGLDQDARIFTYKNYKGITRHREYPF